MSTLYCPSSTQWLSALNERRNGNSAVVAFTIANAVAQFRVNPDAAALDNIGGSLPAIVGFDWGLPFFFGRRVFTALEGATTAAGPGPHIAY